MVDQIEFADVIVLNKVDMIDAENRTRMLDLIRKLNHRAKVLETNYGKIDVKEIVNTGMVCRYPSLPLSPSLPLPQAVREMRFLFWVLVCLDVMLDFPLIFSLFGFFLLLCANTPLAVQSRVGSDGIWLAAGFARHDCPRDQWEEDGDTEAGDGRVIFFLISYHFE